MDSINSCQKWLKCKRNASLPPNVCLVQLSKGRKEAHKSAVKGPYETVLDDLPFLMRKDKLIVFRNGAFYVSAGKDESGTMRGFPSGAIWSPDESAR